MHRQCHLAQINIARALAALDEPLMAGFVARLDDVNALAEASPGFVWRLKSETGNATDVQAFDDPRILVNMSVWRTPEQLKDYVFRSAHVEVMRQRKAWFERPSDVNTALWWVAAGHIPTVEEGKERLEYLRRHGETEFAFSFASLVKSPDTAATQQPEQTPALA